jgi:hypothetical protein
MELLLLKYSEELSMAAAQMESLNFIQSSIRKRFKKCWRNKEIAENAGKLKEQMQSMTANILIEQCIWWYVSAMGNKDNQIISFEL